MKKIIEAADLPEGEKIYFKKDIFGYRMVYPSTNEDGKINWMNLMFGGKRNLLFLLFVLLIVALLALGINEMLEPVRIVFENPQAYCDSLVIKNPMIVYPDVSNFTLNIAK